MSTLQSENHDAIQAQPSTTCNRTTPIFQIKKWNLVATWNWDIHSDMCAICRTDITEACLVCQSESRSGDCQIVWGECNHAFHDCCIVKWVLKNKRCPLCQQRWKNSKSRHID